MEYILVNLFGGGALDWQDVSKTEYYWEEIFSLMRNRLCKNLEDWEINDFYWGVIRYGLEQLENVANELPVIDHTFAVQAGRELRVMVKPDEIDDAGAYKIARDVKEKIEETMQYPGTIKVTVIRETRAQEEAK